MKGNKGITLVALVVTIIVLLILAGVTMAMVMGNDGIFNKAQEAKEQTNDSQELGEVQLAVLEAKTNSMVDGTDLKEELEKSINSTYPNSTVEKQGNGYVITLENGNKYNVDENGRTEKEKIIESVEVILSDGTKVSLTKDNFGSYLGKKVTNYKQIGGTETVAVGSKSYEISTTYRLYYIDFDNKYKEGSGTIYLKADQGPSNYALEQDGSEATSKIRNLNPELYKEGVIPPTATNNNMKAVTWLTDIAKWEGLKTSGLSSEIGDKVKYVVGAPSLEMMMDSYNTHYNLTGDTPDITPIPAAPDTTRRKLFYKYPYDSNNYGYGVGPNAKDSKEFGCYVSDNSVKTDSKIDSMYYSGDNKWYWMASPTAYSQDAVMLVFGFMGGSINSLGYNNAMCALCPLVSLKADTRLKLEN